MDSSAYNPTGDWFTEIIVKGIQSRASDIHFDPDRDQVNVRFRIDGILQQIQSINKFSQDTIISKIRVAAKLDITDRRMPQDGHFEFTNDNRVYNLRVSVLPTVYGETVVIRILNREESLLSLDSLGFFQDQLDTIKQMIIGSSGMILVTGPTGSGKTNLLYSLLNSLNNASRNIVTLEDPIEYEMPIVRQTQINDSIGMTFARAMRTVVRQDPDIIMIGEIRDQDTAQNAIQAALTGILVFCTFHTFDVPGLITRFQEFGVTNSIIAQSMKGVIASRLIRKVCQSCKKPDPSIDVHLLDPKTQQAITEHKLQPNFMKGAGCQACLNTGYLGRTGIFEIVEFGDDLKNTIIDQKSAKDVASVIKNENMRTIRESAMEKVATGETTLEEVIRVLGVK